MKRKLIRILLVSAVGSIMVPAMCMAEEQETETEADYSYLEEMTVKDLKNLDAAIHKILGGTESQTTEIKNVEGNLDYESIYSGAVDQIKSELEQSGNSWTDLQYVLYDMDLDGVAELLIQKGTCNADMAYEIYTTDGSSAVFAGEVYGMAQFIYAAPDKNGFYTYFSRQMCDRINLISLTDGAVSEEEIFNGENVGNTNSYDELKSQIPTRRLGDGMTWEVTEAAEGEGNRSNDYIFPESDRAYLTAEEVRAKNKEQLLYGRNEIYARHGYIFKDDQIRQHFENTSWYQGTAPGDQFDTSVFNEYEIANIDLIVQIENESSSASQPSVDYTGGYIDGTGDDSNYIIMTQNGNLVSYDWYAGSDYSCGETDLPINEDGSVYGKYWNFWFEGNELKVHSGVGVLEPHTFWKVR